MLYATILVASLVASIPSQSGLAPQPHRADTLRAAINRIDFVEPDRHISLLPAFAQAGQQGTRMSTPKRILLTALAGAGGFYAGGVIGSAIDGDCGGCDDPGLLGAVIGAPIGAASAAVVTWLVTGR